MHQFDTTLKLFLQRSAPALLAELGIGPVVEWLSVEMPTVQNRRVDLLGETAAGELIHIEFQSDNDGQIEYRMAVYYLDIVSKLRRYPRQIVIYVGREPMRMKAALETPSMSHRYELVDMRALSGEVLLQSGNVEDNILAILTRGGENREAIRAILEKIGESEPEQREQYLAQVLVLAGLRQLEGIIREELESMPISTEKLIQENTFFQKLREEGRQEGRQEGHREGHREGRQEGEFLLIRRLIEKRFGPLPSWAENRLKGSSASELEELGLKLLDASSLDSLLQ